MTKQNQLRQQILQKKEKLEQAKTQLKKEFIGIDNVIDQVIDSVSSWYLFPDIQTKPVIINLWGLTGSGKTAMVARLAELIDFDKKFYRFDLGNSNDSRWAVKSKLEDIYESENGYPIVLALDEFQFARTLSPMGDELDNSVSRIVWDLLDSGIFKISRYMSGLSDLHDLAYNLRKMLYRGVTVNNGLVTARHGLFLDTLKIRSDYTRNIKGKECVDKRKIPFVPESYYSNISEYMKEELPTQHDVMMHLKKLGGQETIDFLERAYFAALAPKTVDCSKSLIFVMGNMDEAYTMSRDFNPDMSADEFHRLSQQINITDIKKALTARFRNEQIARLGNTHIIYPAFNSATFLAIIKLELQRTAEKVLKSQKLNMSFDESICEMIYREGVYPTQGTRPVFTTIHRIVNTKLGKLITEIALNNIKPSEIIFKATSDTVTVEFFGKKKLLHSFTVKQELNLEKLRKNRQDDVQAINAVHESGHALLAMVLLNTVPEMIYSITADADSNGFVYTSFKWDYISKEQMLKNVAMFLGGHAAEKLIFGDEKITTGSGSDIVKATRFVSDMLKVYGMGAVPAYFQTGDLRKTDSVSDNDAVVNKAVLSIISEGLQLAMQTLKKQQTLLLKMADYLSDNRFMSRETAKEMLMNYAVDYPVSALIEKGDLLFYREQLKQKVHEISVTGNAPAHLPAATFVVSLNKAKNEITNNLKKMKDESNN